MCKIYVYNNLSMWTFFMCAFFRSPISYQSEAVQMSLLPQLNDISRCYTPHQQSPCWFHWKVPSACVLVTSSAQGSCDELVINLLIEAESLAGLLRHSLEREISPFIRLGNIRKCQFPEIFTAALRRWRHKCAGCSRQLVVCLMV